MILSLGEGCIEPMDLMFVGDLDASDTASYLCEGKDCFCLVGTICLGMPLYLACKIPLAMSE